MSNRRRNLQRTIRANANRRRLRAAVGEAQPSGQGYPGPGAVNAYRCGDCEQLTVTIHVDTGVTPMLLGCLATDGCTGRGMSGMYGIPSDRLPAPTHEWYRPEGRELRALNGPAREHADLGGLMLRQVTG